MISEDGRRENSVEWFSDYASLVAQRYGDRVKRFATFNEPSIFTLFGLGFGKGQRATASAESLHKSIHHVNLAHGAAVDILRERVAGSFDRGHPQLPAVPAVDTGRCRSSKALRRLLE